MARTSKKTGNLKPRNLDMSTIKGGSRNRKGVQNLSDYVEGEVSTQLSSLKDQTIYIVKLQPMKSDQYGDGFKIWYKDFPNAVDTLKAHTFGMVTVPVLDQLWHNTNEGKRISLDSPIKATVRVNGRATTLE